jgi:hypothetical protein
MLDGKAECVTSLHWLFIHKFKELCEGQRMPSTYFDVRFILGSALSIFTRLTRLLSTDLTDW